MKDHSIRWGMWGRLAAGNLRTGCQPVRGRIANPPAGWLRPTCPTPAAARALAPAVPTSPENCLCPPYFAAVPAVLPPAGSAILPLEDPGRLPGKPPGE